MKLAFRLAYRNLVGAGLRTWLNVFVLSVTFVVIIWMNGVLHGWELQAKTDMTGWEIGNGQFWHEKYDPYDPMMLDESHAVVPPEMNDGIREGSVVPVLMVQASLYIRGRMQPVVIRGIPPEQNLLKIPSGSLNSDPEILHGVIGVSMANSSKLKIGDECTLRWRDMNGTFDATSIRIADIFASNVPSAEAGQIYIALEKLRKMMGLPDHATTLTYAKSETGNSTLPGWINHTNDDLTKQVDQLIRTKSKGLTVFYFVLLLLSMLAVFDTQVLSIFRRQKEIGTYVALGYTRRQVVGLFTVEGTMHAVLAALLAAVYGVPFLIWQARTGWTMPMDTSQFGMAIAQTLYPVYSAGLVISTILIVTVITAMVSYWPSHRINRMNPTDALKGKLQ
jgi:ABC-type lipoprotein release transport system permease subunit